MKFSFSTLNYNIVQSNLLLIKKKITHTSSDFFKTAIEYHYGAPFENNYILDRPKMGVQSIMRIIEYLLHIAFIIKLSLYIKM